MRAITPQAMKFIEQREGRRLDAYRDSAGYWTIGVGHLVTKDKNAPRPPSITHAEADELFRQDLEPTAGTVEHAVTVSITDNQFAALLSLAFNIGVTAFASSTLVKKLNAGDIAGAAAEFSRWDKAGGKVVDGLTRRRAAECDLFLLAGDR